MKIFKYYSGDITKLALAISRVDLKKPDSQDVHVFFGAHDFNFQSSQLNSQVMVMGYRGCDNRLASELIHRYKYNVYNPCHDFIINHNHKSNFRPSVSYHNDGTQQIETVHQRVFGPFEFVYPCWIKDIPDLDYSHFVK